MLRRDYEGAEAAASVSQPGETGLDTEQVSTLWGGALGRGRMTIAFDSRRRQEVRDKDRDFSRTLLPTSGRFADARGISGGGNTVYFYDGQSPRTAVLGDCPTDVYAGRLSTRDTDQVCGFDYGAIKWLDGFERTERNSLFVSADHPLAGDTDIYVDARFARGKDAFRYAPAVGFFGVAADEEFKAALAASNPGLEADDIPDGVAAFHRFAAHGNRDWRTDTHEYEVTAGVRSRAGGGIGHDVRLRTYRYDSVQKGGSFVGESLIGQAVAAGHYDVADPTDPDLGAYPEHWDAVRNTTVRLRRDYVSDHRTARVAFNGETFSAPGGAVRWTAGTALAHEDYRRVYDHRTLGGDPVPTLDVLGSSGSSAAGERTRWSSFAALDIPLLDAWDVSMAVRQDDHDDVGAVFNRQVASRYRLVDGLALRGAWTEGGRPPSLHTLHEYDAVDSPFVCDKLTLAPGEACVPVQHRRLITGNPNLKPDKTRTVSVGAEAELGPFSMGLDWFQTDISDAPSAPSAQLLLDLEAAGAPLPPGARVVRNGENGPIGHIESRTANVADIDVSGFVLRQGARWETAWADMALDLHWLRVTGNERRVNGLLEPNDPPRDRVHASLQLTRGNVSALWSGYSISGYRNSSGNGSFKAWRGHDLAVRWSKPFGIAGVHLIGGVLNIGDRGPSIDSSDADQQDLTLDSVRGRTVFLRFATSW